MHSLFRRGFHLGTALNKDRSKDTHPLVNWANGYPVVLDGLCADAINSYQESIEHTEQLVLAILDGQECGSLLAQPYYSDRLTPHFEALGCTINEGDDQEIETLLFDAMENGEVTAEDLWVKVSWLSFHEEDASLRFRFSFGIDHVEDVAADAHRQHYAAQLTDAVFPESAIITNSRALQTTLLELMQTNDIRFVERIIYFNAPNGGAYLHHDLERGHAGVVYAQISGSTYWLALPKTALLEEITTFVNNGVWPESLTHEQKKALGELVKDREKLSKELGSFANTTLIQLINETKEFVQHLIAQGHSRTLVPGDVLLLPQENEEKCCWHSVFCLGDEAGQALSFAVRGDQ